MRGRHPSRFLQISFAFGPWTHSLEWINGVGSQTRNKAQATKLHQQYTSSWEGTLKRIIGKNGSFWKIENLQYKKQQTRFSWICSWELMESATILTPPSTVLSSILFSARTELRSQDSAPPLQNYYKASEHIIEYRDCEKCFRAPCAKFGDYEFCKIGIRYREQLNLCKAATLKKTTNRFSRPIIA